jgi:hypothetical protein
VVQEVQYMLKRKNNKAMRMESTTLGQERGSTTLPASTEIQSPAQEAVHHAVILGDLSRCTKRQLMEYHNEVCKSLGLNALTKPFDYLMLGKAGEQKLTLYANKNCTDQLRALHGISIAIVEEREAGGLYFVKARAQIASTGKADEDYGVVPLPDWMREPKNAAALANTYMRCVTKAKRRVTLSICGLGGIMDETELDTVPADEKRVLDLRGMEDDDVIELLPEKQKPRRLPTEQEAAAFNPPDSPPPPHGNGKVKTNGSGERTARSPKGEDSSASEASVSGITFLPPGLPEQDREYWMFPISRGVHLGRPCGQLPLPVLKNYLSNHKLKIEDDELYAITEVIYGKERAEWEAREKNEEQAPPIPTSSKKEKAEADRVPEETRAVVNAAKETFPGATVERGDAVKAGTRGLQELGKTKVCGGPHAGRAFEELETDYLVHHLEGNIAKEKQRGSPLLTEDYKTALRDLIRLRKEQELQERQAFDADDIPEFV